MEPSVDIAAANTDAGGGAVPTGALVKGGPAFG